MLFLNQDWARVPSDLANALRGRIGRVFATSTWRQAVLDEKVPLVSTVTLADRIGQWPEYIITALTVAAFAWALAMAWRRRDRTRPES